MTLVMVFGQAILSFIVLMVLTRIIGKQQVSQLTYYEYINGITFGSIAANMATDEFYNMGEHLVGLITYGLLTLLVSYITMKNRKLRKVMTGEPVIVIQDGQILENNLRKMNMDLDELTMELRVKDIFDFSQLKLALIEPSGEVSVIRKAQYEPPTREDLNVKAKAQSLPVEVIVDGQVIYHNLQSMKLDGQWLMKQLRQRKIKSVREVAFATVDSDHKLIIDLYDDHIPGMMDISDGEDIKLSLDERSDEKNKAPSENWGKRPDKIIE